ncbi:MAG: gliding motility-associated C-terminal domain-containing protein [Paludibacteraceae bacterium]|nr:gliding motility-associated C-terminal domain-containing protein [Paludibacteraceae bacterium]
MKKLFLISLIFVSVGWCSAARLIRAVSLSNSRYEIENPKGADYLYLYESYKDISLETISGKDAVWTELATGRQSKGTNVFQNVTDGYCYSVEIDGQKETFVFIDYSKHRLTAMSEPEVEMNCSNTQLKLNTWTPITYLDSLGNTQSLPLECSVTYTTQQWNDKSWADVQITDTVALTDRYIVLDSILTDTKFVIAEENISPIFYGAADSYETTVYEAVAIAHHKQSYIAKRGKQLENEKDGPYEGNTHIESAPLDILFESNPSAKADFYTWTIKQGQSEIVSRNDRDLHYYFDDASSSGPITYWVELKLVNSSHPECYLTAMDTVTLNSSFILVPNVFTPNGDGMNDEFKVVYRSVCEFHCWIFNRWQHLIYSWDDPAKGWNGNYNGRKEPDGAYIYIIEAKGCDGQKFNLKGTVNLLTGK